MGSATHDILLSFSGIFSRIFRVTDAKLPVPAAYSAKITAPFATKEYTIAFPVPSASSQPGNAAVFRRDTCKPGRASVVARISDTPNPRFVPSIAHVLIRPPEGGAPRTSSAEFAWLKGGGPFFAPAADILADIPRLS